MSRKRTIPRWTHNNISYLELGHKINTAQLKPSVSEYYYHYSTAFINLFEVETKCNLIYGGQFGSIMCVEDTKANRRKYQYLKRKWKHVQQQILMASSYSVAYGLLIAR